MWLSTPMLFIALGRFQWRFGRGLAPGIWDKNARVALHRRSATLGRRRDGS